MEHLEIIRAELTEIMELEPEGEQLYPGVHKRYYEAGKFVAKMFLDSNIETFTDAIHIFLWYIYNQAKQHFTYRDASLKMDMQRLEKAIDEIGKLLKDQSLRTDEALWKEMTSDKYLQTRRTLTAAASYIEFRTDIGDIERHAVVNLINDFLAYRLFDLFKKGGDRIQNQKDTELTFSGHETKPDNAFTPIPVESGTAGSSGFRAIKRPITFSEIKETEMEQDKPFSESKYVRYTHLIKLPSKDCSESTLLPTLREIDSSNGSPESKILSTRLTLNELFPETEYWISKFLRLIFEDDYERGKFDYKIRRIVDHKTGKKTGSIQVRIENDMMSLKDLIIKNKYDMKKALGAVDLESFIGTWICGVFALGIEDRYNATNTLFKRSPTDKYICLPIDTITRGGREHMERVKEFAKIISTWDFTKRQYPNLERLKYLLIEAVYSECYFREFVFNNKKLPHKCKNFTPSEINQMDRLIGTIMFVKEALKNVSAPEILRIMQKYLTKENIEQIEALHPKFMESCQTMQVDLQGVPVNYNLLDGLKILQEGIQNSQKRSEESKSEALATPKPSITLVNSSTPNNSSAKDNILENPWGRSQLSGSASRTTPSQRPALINSGASNTNGYSGIPLMSSAASRNANRPSSLENREPSPSVSLTTPPKRKGFFGRLFAGV